jgi:hypothetical protein
MDEARFWSMIEDAWASVEDSAAARNKLAKGELDEESAGSLVQRSWTEMLPSLQASLERLEQDELLGFDRILERKLYDLDRPEIQEHTDGSEDGFLYCRAFIVAAGRSYYEAVNSEPSRAMMDLECEDLCYLPVRVYSAKFGEMPGSGISRETGSNQAAWSDSDD